MGLVLVQDLPQLTVQEVGDLARHLAGLQQQMTLLLVGPLGVGKTTFCRHFIQAVCPSATVPSPSFPLIIPYETRQGPLWHVDLYRLHTAVKETCEALGLMEAFNTHSLLIEWPERLPPVIYENKPLWIVKLTYTQQPDLRAATVWHGMLSPTQHALIVSDLC